MHSKKSSNRSSKASKFLLMPKLTGGAGSLLPPGLGRRHAHPDGGGLGEPGAERGGNHRSGAGLNGAGAGGRQAGRQRTAVLQRKEGHPDVGCGSAQCRQRRHSAIALKHNRLATAKDPW